jgi:Acetyltransferase (isoleucine patch superfamily)
MKVLFFLCKKLVSFAILFVKGGVRSARYIGVTVGENCRIYTTHFGTEPFLITIGNDVTVTSNVSFITHDGSTWLMRDEKGRRYKYAPISIGNNVFVGTGSIIMPGVKIEDNVIIAAGSIVTKSIPCGVVVAGVPAKIINSYDDIKRRMLNENFSDEDLDKTLNYKERVFGLLTKEYKPYLKYDDKNQK